MNVFQYAFTAEENWKANLADMTDWRPQYTFYSDFGIAEFCEVYMRDRNAVLSTYRNVIKNWASDYKALTEIILVLNHKIWAFYNRVDSGYMKVSNQIADYFAKLYNKLYEQAIAEFFKRYENNTTATDYYYRVTD